MAKKTEEPEVAEATPAKVTQKEAVKQAIAAGKDQPKAGIEFIKTTFGMELASGSFSTLKSLLKSEGGTKEKKKPDGPAGVATPKVHPVGNGKAANAADLARGVKALVALHGADAVAEMAKVFAD